MGVHEGTREACVQSSDRVDTEILLSTKEIRDSESRGGTAAGYEIIGIVILFFLGLNLQGVAGGSALSFDRGGFVFRVSTAMVVGVMLERLLSGGYYFSSTMLPTGRPVGLARFIVVIEVARGFIRCFTLGIRLLANMLVGQILLFIWISVVTSVFFLLTSLDLSWYLMVWVYLFVGPVIFVGSLAFCYEMFVYFFQSFLFGMLLLFYFEDRPHARQVSLHNQSAVV